MVGLMNRNKWLLLVVACGILVGLAVFSLSAEQRQRKELASRLNQALLEKEALSSQVKDVQGILEPLRQEVDLLRNSLVAPKKEELPANSSGNRKPDYGLEAKKEPVKSVPEVLPRGKSPGAKGRLPDIEQRLANIKNYKKDLEGQNAALKERVEELSGFLEHKESEMSRLKNENLGFKDQLAKAGRDQEDLRRKLSLNISDTDLLRKQLSSRVELENQIGELNNKLLLLKETNSAIEKQMAQYRQDKSVLEQELDKSRQEVNKRGLEAETLNKNILELKRNLSGREADIQGLTNEISALRVSKKKLELDMQELSAFKDSSSSQIHQLNSRMSDLNLSSESMKNTINQLSGLLAKKEADIYNNKDEISSLKSELGNMLHERDALAASLSEKEESVSGLTAKLTHMESQVTFLQGELASAKDSQKAATEQLAQLKLVNSSLRQKFQNISKALEPIYMQGESASPAGGPTQNSEQDKIIADELRKKVEVELDLEK